MSETYREEQEANFAEQQSKSTVGQRFTKKLEDIVGVPNAFGSEDLDEEEYESVSDTEEDEIPDGTEDLSYFHESAFDKE
jgi:hypothetical protein